MAKTVEFLFDVVSPTAYLAWTALDALKVRTGAEIVMTPILLGGLLKASGNASPIESPAKSAYIMADCIRIAEKRGVPLNPNPHFPLNTMMVMRAIVGAARAGDANPLTAAAFKAMWVDQAKLDDPNALEQLAETIDVRVATLAGWIGDDSIKAELRHNTDDAARRGAFGAPTFFVGTEMFFGQDRMEWVEEAAAAS